MSKLPDAPGVYIFKDSRGRKLYIGKATSLRDRVRSYASDDLSLTRGPLIEAMFQAAATVDFIVTDSVLEALILEAHLIKKYLPPHNTKDKDNKSFNYVVITREAFPRVLMKRGREILMLGRDMESDEYKEVFGPFPNGSALRDALKIMRRIFPYRDTCIPAAEIPPGKHIKPCFNSSIGLCPGVCAGTVTKQEYAKTIRRIALFFQGNMKRLIRSLEKDMERHAEKQQFEEAARVRKMIFALQHIQDVSLISRDAVYGPRPQDSSALGSVFRIEAYDIAHLGGSATVGAMVVVHDGEVQTDEYRRFRIRRAAGPRGKGNDDVGNLTEMFTRRLAHPEWPMPQLIVVDGTGPQRRAVEALLAERNLAIPVVSVVKDEHHKPRDIQSDSGLGQGMIEPNRAAILLANSEAHRFAMSYHRLRRGKNFLP